MADYKVANDTGNESIQDLPDIMELAKTYLLPIDDFRSIVKPVRGFSTNVSNEKLPPKEQDKSFTESRAHAFYRMIGFPVGVSDNYYNSGYPTSLGGEDKKININQEVLDKFGEIFDEREKWQENVSSLFFNKNFSGSLYAFLLRFSRPFDFINFTIIDKQKYDVEYRNKFCQIMLQIPQEEDKKEIIINAAEAITKILGGIGSGQHIITPFCIDPDIAATVMPDSKIICVPFLKTKDDTLISKEPTTYLYRPGIEAIIRARLTSGNTIKADYISKMKSYLNNDKLDPDTILSLSDDLLFISNISENNKLTDKVEQEISGYVDFQLKTLIKITQILELLITKLIENQLQIDFAFKEIGWMPVPNQNGPEMGAIGASSTSVPGSIGNELDIEIAMLNIKIFSAKYTAQDILSLGNFASPFEIQPDDLNKYNDRLSELKKKKEAIGNNALNAMGILELIMGEVSGLGLIDVFAVYYALWSMDDKYLIAFLDDASFLRMQNNAKLTSPAVVNRINGIRESLESAYTELETRVNNFYGVAQRIYTKLINNST